MGIWDILSKRTGQLKEFETRGNCFLMNAILLTLFRFSASNNLALAASSFFFLLACVCKKKKKKECRQETEMIDALIANTHSMYTTAEL